MSMQVSNQMG